LQLLTTLNSVIGGHEAGPDGIGDHGAAWLGVETKPIGRPDAKKRQAHLMPGPAGLMDSRAGGGNPTTHPHGFQKRIVVAWWSSARQRPMHARFCHSPRFLTPFVCAAILVTLTMPDRSQAQLG
jgi:hypothetical protein